MDKICIVTSPTINSQAKAILERAVENLAAANCTVLHATDQGLGSAQESTRVHDLREALMTMDHAMRDLEKGYRFDDEFAEEKRKAIRKAVTTLNHEGQAWLDVIRGQTKPISSL